ncbi:MLX-interacting protein isoform X2 [Gadus macrocephalus]|uniref:MLX-interacting protein isoform X2 n=1 Tax=Gadus macrocephalus TaxID=80720 RepID=UPI0028CB40A6|nr:MLX-interacting protein isoform X2 [Gadus macrocephalus]
MAAERYRYRHTAAGSLQDADSDPEEPQLVYIKSDGREAQIIHSGHFMVSAPHIEHPPKKGYDFDTVNKQTCQTYHFGKTSTSHISIDASLTKLFECMTVAYSGKLVSPKWKNFKGLKLLWRDKIRLNNAIWRAWYMQYVEKRENPVCHFVTPLDGNMESEVHRPSMAIATEGNYWKRRIEIVIREYHKWRTYFKKRLQKHKDDDLSSLLQDEESAMRRVARKVHDSPIPMEMDQLFDMDVLMSEFSDTLFSTLASHQPVACPNERDIAHAVNADMIQPGLITLQPNLDFMDSFEPLQDLFHSLRQPFLPTVSPTAPSLSPLPSSSSQLMSSMQLSAEGISGQALGPLGPHSTASQSSGTDAHGCAYVQGYMPLFPQRSTSASQPGGPQPVAHGPHTHCLPDDHGSLSGITHTTAASSTSAVPSDVSSTYNQGLEYSSAPTQKAQTLLVSQLLPLAPCPANKHQTFALPRPIHNSGGNKAKGRHMQRIVPANNLPSSHLVLTGQFSTGPSALIVTPAPLKAEVVPSAGMVITSSSLAPAFHIVPQTHKSPQAIVPKEETYSSSCKGQKTSSQGSPCGPDGLHSPLGSSEFLKNDPNQMNLCLGSSSRRVPHISAEQKRRFNINIGFKTLCNLVPTLKAQSNITNATTLQKTVEHLGKLQQDRQQLQEEARRLREEVEELNGSISRCQEQLPGTGVSMARSRFNHVHEFEAYVKSRTLQNWKFWIFSIIIKPLFESFNNTVSTACEAELCQTTLEWLDHHCSLPVLRAMVCSTLRQLGTKTSILTEPSLLHKEVFQAIGSAQRPCGDS